MYFYFYTVLHALAARRRAHVPHVPFHTALRQALTLSTSPVLLGVPTELAVGFIAGVASRAISTPLGVLTVRLQSGEDDSDETGNESEAGDADEQSKAKRMRDGIMTVIRSIYAEQGIRGFWAGQYPFLRSLAPADPAHRLCTNTPTRADPGTDAPLLPATPPCTRPAAPSLRTRVPRRCLRECSSARVTLPARAREGTRASGAWRNDGGRRVGAAVRRRGGAACEGLCEPGRHNDGEAAVSRFVWARIRLVGPRADRC